MQRKTLVLAVTLALAATSFSASAQDSRDAEIAALKQQLMDLAAKVQELESRTDAQSEVNVDTATQLDTLANNSTKVETKGGSNKVPMPRWTQTEIEQLRALYPDLANLTVARRLGRTVTSVANKANQLGLKKSPHLLADIGRTNVGMRYGREPGVVSEEGRTNVAEGAPGKNADPDLPGAAAADAAG